MIRFLASLLLLAGLAACAQPYERQSMYGEEPAAVSHEHYAEPHHALHLSDTPLPKNMPASRLEEEYPCSGSDYRPVPAQEAHAKCWVSACDQNKEPIVGNPEISVHGGKGYVAGGRIVGFCRNWLGVDARLQSAAPAPPPACCNPVPIKPLPAPKPAPKAQAKPLPAPQPKLPAHPQACILPIPKPVPGLEFEGKCEVKETVGGGVSKTTIQTPTPSAQPKQPCPEVCPSNKEKEFTPKAS